jgi:hypothetical protein
MPRTRRHRSRLSWSLWITFLGLTAAVACASHPPGHDHDVGHPPLCTDTSGPAMLAPDRSTRFPDGGTFPLSLKSLFPLVSLAAPGAQIPLGLPVWPGDLSQNDTRTSANPPMFLVVLRQ